MSYPWLTIQCRSPTICQPQHSAGRDDKDRCDEKQPRQQACAPFVAGKINFQSSAEPLECFRMWTPRSKPTWASTKCASPLEASRSRLSCQSRHLPNYWRRLSPPAEKVAVGLWI